jgi:hypothetical protein
VTQSWALDLEHFPGVGRPFHPLYHHRHRPGTILVPLPPLQSIEAVTYIDAVGAQQTVDPADYIVHLARA